MCVQSQVRSRDDNLFPGAPRHETPDSRLQIPHARPQTPILWRIEENTEYRIQSTVGAQRNSPGGTQLFLTLFLSSILFSILFFIFLFFTDARRASDKTESEKLESCHVTLLPLFPWVLLPFLVSVSVSVSVPIVGVIVVVFLVY